MEINDGYSIQGGATSSMDNYNPSGSNSHSPRSSDSGSHSGGQSGGRRHLQPSDCVDQRAPRSRYRILGGNGTHGRRYTNASFSLLSPGLGSETHLRASQSLSCLTEVCEAPESPRIVTGPIEIPVSSLSTTSTLNVSSTRLPAKSCSNLEKIEETVTLDPSQELVLLMCSPPLLASHPVDEKEFIDTVNIQDVVMDTEPEPPHTSCGCTCTTLSTGKKQKRLKQLFSRREGSSSSFKVNNS